MAGKVKMLVAMEIVFIEVLLLVNTGKSIIS